MKLSLDFYKGFDEHFFAEKNREQAAQGYRTFLEQHQDKLNAAFADPTMLLQDKQFYTGIQKVGNDEQIHILNLQKPPQLKITLEDITAKSGVQLVNEQRRYATGRIQWHLARLMFPMGYCPSWNYLKGIQQQPANSTCDSFGQEFIQYLATTPPETSGHLGPKDSSKFQEVVGLDRSAFFWTMAPYVHLNAKERGLSAPESMERIVRWVVDAYDKEKCGDNDLGRNFPYAYGIIQQKPGLNALGFDERMPSHLKARLLAREVAEELTK